MPFRKKIKIEKSQMQEEIARVDTSALAATAALTGLSTNTDTIRAKVAGGTTVTFSFVAKDGGAWSYTEAPLVMIQVLSASGTVTLTSTAVDEVVVEASAGTVDFHIRILGTRKPVV